MLDLVKFDSFSDEDVVEVRILADALDDDGLVNRFKGDELVTDNDGFESLNFEEKAEVDVSSLEFKLESLTDGKLVDGT